MVNGWACLKSSASLSTITGWWFGTFVVPYIGNNDPNWLSYFSEGLNHQPNEKSGQIMTTSRRDLTPKWCFFFFLEGNHPTIGELFRWVKSCNLSRWDGWCFKYGILMAYWLDVMYFSFFHDIYIIYIYIYIYIHIYICT